MNPAPKSRRPVWRTEWPVLLTQVTSIVTYSQPRTNLLPGCVHLLLFLAYLMLMFER